LEDRDNGSISAAVIPFSGFWIVDLIRRKIENLFNLELMPMRLRQGCGTQISKH
jgi:hypothetical protein